MGNVIEKLECNIYGRLAVIIVFSIIFGSIVVEYLLPYAMDMARTYLETGP